MHMRRPIYRKMQFERNFSKRVKLSLTPLIDMVFLLVVFFMLTTTFSEDESIKLSFASNTPQEQQESKSRHITIKVVENGKVYLGQRQMAAQDLREALRDILKKNPERGIVLKSDDKASVQHLVTVMDQIGLAGGKNITLSE